MHLKKEPKTNDNTSLFTNSLLTRISKKKSKRESVREERANVKRKENSCFVVLYEHAC